MFQTRPLVGAIACLPVILTASPSWAQDHGAADLAKAAQEARRHPAGDVTQDQETQPIATT